MLLNSQIPGSWYLKCTLYILLLICSGVEKQQANHWTAMCVLVCLWHGDNITICVKKISKNLKIFQSLRLCLGYLVAQTPWAKPKNMYLLLQEKSKLRISNFRVQDASYCLPRAVDAHVSRCCGCPRFSKNYFKFEKGSVWLQLVLFECTAKYFADISSIHERLTCWVVEPFRHSAVAPSGTHFSASSHLSLALCTCTDRCTLRLQEALCSDLLIYMGPICLSGVHCLYSGRYWRIRRYMRSYF